MLSSDHSLEPLQLFRFSVVGATRRQARFCCGLCKARAGLLLVADRKTVTVVVRTMRRVYIVGAVLGNTNVFFYDDDGREIAALDVCVSEYRHPRYDKSGIGSHAATIASTL